MNKDLYIELLEKEVRNLRNLNQDLEYSLKEKEEVLEGILHNEYQYNIAQNKDFAQKGVGTYMATRTTPAMTLSFMAVRLLVAVSYYSLILVLSK